MTGMLQAQGAARRARTIVATARHVEMGVLSDRRLVDRHVVELDGSVLARAESIAGDCLDPLLRGVPSPVIDLVAVDVSSVPQPDRQRGSIWARGRVELVTQPLSAQWRQMLGLTCVEPVLRFRPESVTLREGMGLPVAQPASVPTTVPITVPIETYRQEGEDALAHWEGEWLPHLDLGHGDAVRHLAQTRMDLGPDVRVHPLVVDEDGLVLRVYDGEAVVDLRFLFPWPARCRCSAIAGFEALMAGMRA